MMEHKYKKSKPQGKLTFSTNACIEDNYEGVEMQTENLVEEEFSLHKRNTKKSLLSKEVIEKLTIIWNDCKEKNEKPQIPMKMVKDVAELYNLKDKQVQNWFQNKRDRTKQKDRWWEKEKVTTSF